MYLHIPAEVGIPGGILYFLFFFGQGVMSWRIWRRGVGVMKLFGLSGMLLVLSAAIDGIGDYALSAARFPAASGRCLRFVFQKKDGARQGKSIMRIQVHIKMYLSNRKNL